MRIHLVVMHNNEVIPITLQGSEKDIREGRLGELKVSGAFMSPPILAKVQMALKRRDYTVVTQPARFVTPLSNPPMEPHEDVGARAAEIACAGASLCALKPALEVAVHTMRASGVGYVPAVATTALITTVAVLPGVILASATGAYVAGKAVNWAESRKNQ